MNYGVTIAKALTIILMVLGHTGCPEPINNFLMMMRMPLFFIMSGYCFKDKYLTDSSVYLKKRVTGIYVPYVKYSLLFLALHNLFFDVNIYDENYGAADGSIVSPYSIHDFLLRFAGIVTCLVGHDPLLGGFWFIHDLFWGSFIFFFTLKLLKSRCWCAVLTLVLAVVLSYFELGIPHIGINSRTFLAAFFITFGHVYKQSQLTFETRPVFMLLAFVFIAINTAFWHTDMLHYNWWQTVPYALTAIIGVLMIFGFSQFFYQFVQKHAVTPLLYINRFLIYTGKHTFNVLAWHFLSFKLVSLLIIFLYSLPIQQLAEFPNLRPYSREGWWPLFWCVGFMVPITISWLYNRIRNHWTRPQTILSFVLIATSLSMSCTREDASLVVERKHMADTYANYSLSIVREAYEEQRPITKANLSADGYLFVEWGEGMQLLVNVDDAKTIVSFGNQTLSFVWQDSIIYSFPIKPSDGATSVNYNMSYAQPTRPIRILAIGNSYTQDALYFMSELCKASGIPPENLCIYLLAAPGASLQYWHDIYQDHTSVTLQHVAGSATVNSISGPLSQLLAQHWDIVTLQQVSSKAIDYNSIHQPLLQLSSMIRESSLNTDVQVAWQIAWAYWTGYSTFPYGYDRWRQIKDTVGKAIQTGCVDFVIPVGTAIQNARETTLNTPHDLTRDGTHLAYGSAMYIAGCTWFQSVLAPLFHQNLLKNSFIPSVNDQQQINSNYECGDVNSENQLLCKICAMMAYSKWQEVSADCEDITH